MVTVRLASGSSRNLDENVRTDPLSPQNDVCDENNENNENDENDENDENNENNEKETTTNTTKTSVSVGIANSIPTWVYVCM